MMLYLIFGFCRFSKINLICQHNSVKNCPYYTTDQVCTFKTGYGRGSGGAGGVTNLLSKGGREREGVRELRTERQRERQKEGGGQTGSDR